MAVRTGLLVITALGLLNARIRPARLPALEHLDELLREGG